MQAFNETLLLGNKLWVGHDFANDILPAYVERLNSGFRAEFEALDSDGQKATEAVNDWVNQLTRGKISELFGECYDCAMLCFVT